jgi:Na+-transporting methylmalonyl-CoA/oxaloacetate decarboxylase gamma subunit
LTNKAKPFKQIVRSRKRCFTRQNSIYGRKIAIQIEIGSDTFLRQFLFIASRNKNSIVLVKHDPLSVNRTLKTCLLLKPNTWPDSRVAERLKSFVVILITFVITITYVIYYLFSPSCISQFIGYTLINILNIHVNHNQGRGLQMIRTVRSIRFLLLILLTLGFMSVNVTHAAWWSSDDEKKEEKQNGKRQAKAEVRAELTRVTAAQAKQSKPGENNETAAKDVEWTTKLTPEQEDLVELLKSTRYKPVKPITKIPRPYTSKVQPQYGAPRIQKVYRAPQVPQPVKKTKTFESVARN